MRLTAKNYNRLVPRLIVAIRKDLEHADDALFSAISGGEGEISRWPEDEEFEDWIRNYGVYGVVGQPRLIMALAAVEASLYSEKTDMPSLAEGLSLEHLMPQGWEEHWSLPGQLDANERKAAADERNRRLHRLGNLTIVTQALNASLSNGPWAAKRSGLNAHSKLLLNSRLGDYEEWTDHAIDERGAFLARRLLEIWPGPSNPVWTTGSSH